MKYDIAPLKGVGPFLFGMTPDEVRRATGQQFNSFKRTPSATYPCDHFPKLGLFANYTPEGKLEAVEFASPAKPMLDGASLLELAFAKVKALLEKQDLALEIEADAVISHKLGISVYAPLAKENEQERSESIMVFAKGYYE